MIYTVSPRMAVLPPVPACTQILITLEDRGCIHNIFPSFLLDKKGDAVCDNKFLIFGQLRNKSIGSPLSAFFLPSGFPSCSPFKNFPHYSANIIRI